MTQAFQFRVKGMTCDGCVRAVTNAIKARAPSANVAVDLAKGTVTVDSADPAVVAQAIEDAGYGFAPA
ncbi:MAG TPA: heavy-metal-associated domain-containing protein [Alphaproteobacteria bacterium]|nr:heavy-metal-associated domain-containing protein [Alphaproteobacteria bacterium]